MSRMPGDDYDTAPMPPSVWDDDLDEGRLDDWLWQPPVDRQPSPDRAGQGGLGTGSMARSRGVTWARAGPCGFCCRAPR